MIKLIRFASNPSELYLITIKNVLRYLKGIKSLDLIYRKINNKYASGYYDADYAEDIDTIKSISGYFIYLINCLIS